MASTAQRDKISMQPTENPRIASWRLRGMFCPKFVTRYISLLVCSIRLQAPACLRASRPSTAVKLLSSYLPLTAHQHPACVTDNGILLTSCTRLLSDVLRPKTAHSWLHATTERKLCPTAMAGVLLMRTLGRMRTIAWRSCFQPIRGRAGLTRRRE